MIYSDLYWSRSQVDARMRSNPGETWLLWNEPERPEQTAHTPERAAELGREFLQRAWATGIEFQWAAAGVGAHTADYDGLTWAASYAQNMRLRGVSRPSYWHVHGYRSGNLSAFRQSWAAWRAWYATWGAGAPVVLSEVCAEGAPLADQMAVMSEARDMLRRGDVCGVTWFVASGSEWPNTHLCAGSGLTALGEYWRGLK